MLQSLERAFKQLSKNMEQIREGKQAGGSSSSQTTSSSTSHIKKSYQDLKELKSVVKRKVQKSLDDIIQETEGNVVPPMHLNL